MPALQRTYFSHSVNLNVSGPAELTENPDSGAKLSALGFLFTIICREGPNTCMSSDFSLLSPCTTDTIMSLGA